MSDGTITEAQRYELLTAVRELQQPDRREKISVVVEHVRAKYGDEEANWLVDRLNDEDAANVQE